MVLLRGCLFLLVLSLGACQWFQAAGGGKVETALPEGLPLGVKAYEEQFYYQLHQDSNNLTAVQPGDQLRMDYSIWKGAERLDHSYENRYPILVQMPEPDFHNFFTRALSLMTEGDSLDLYIEAQKAGELLGSFGAAFEAEDWVHFSYKIQSHKSLATWQAEQQAEGARQDSIYRMMQDLVVAYKTDSLEGMEQQLSGLEYKILNLGEAPLPQDGDFVRMHYSCWLLEDVAEVQNSFNSAEPVDFIVGDASLILGWSFGAELIGLGGSAFLVIPPKLAYGEKGVEGSIPPNAVLCFYIENIDIIYKTIGD